MMIPKLTLLLVLLMSVVASAPAQSPSPPITEPSLSPGDRVRITVWGMPEMSGEFLVSPDGTLEHPLYRQVEVAGVPVSVAEQRLADFLRQRDARSQFALAPMFRVAVGGEVARPDLYHHSMGVTVAHAITLAGGVSPQGNLSSVRLIRDGVASQLDLTDPSNQAATIEIRSGDQIIVARERSIMRDYITPASSVIGAISGVLLLLLRAEIL